MPKPMQASSLVGTSTRSAATMEVGLVALQEAVGAPVDQHQGVGTGAPDDGPDGLRQRYDAPAADGVHADVPDAPLAEPVSKLFLGVVEHGVGPQPDGPTQRSDLVLYVARPILDARTVGEAHVGQRDALPLPEQPVHQRDGAHDVVAATAS